MGEAEVVVPMDAFADALMNARMDAVKACRPGDGMAGLIPSKEVSL